MKKLENRKKDAVSPHVQEMKEKKSVFMERPDLPLLIIMSLYFSLFFATIKRSMLGVG